MIINANALHIPLADKSVQCIVTSPPYWGLRDYGTAKWEGGAPECKHNPQRPDGGDRSDRTLPLGRGGLYRTICGKCGALRIDNQLGLERTPEEYISNMVGVFRECWRVLRNDGTLWLNVGDSYAANGSGNGHNNTDAVDSNPMKSYRSDKYTHQRSPKTTGNGIKPKDLVGIPWRLAFALQADGWYLRSDIIWCLSHSTRVYAKTQKGEMPMTIGEMVRLKPETVKLWTGEKWAQVKGFSKSPETIGIEIELRSGQRISCTPNHSWPTKRGEVQAKDLQIGDCLNFVRLPRSETEEPEGIPSKFGWVVGFYIAEGSPMKGDGLQFAMSSDEDEEAEKLREFAEYYGSSCTVFDYGKQRHVHILGGAAGSIVRMYVNGEGCKHKHLSTAAWQRDTDFLYLLMNGYLDGDGHFDGSRWRLGFARNDAWADDLRTLCAKLGYSLRLKRHWNKNQDGQFYGFRGDLRTDIKGRRTDDMEIVGIQKSKSQSFYDIGIEEPHVFALASGVLTHNSKPNPMPESVTDRPTKSHEYLFLLAKQERYYYDQEAIRDNVTELTIKHLDKYPIGTYQNVKNDISRNDSDRVGNALGDKSGRNRRTVWTIPTVPYKGAHFATFPPALVEPCIKAGTSERGACPKCGKGWRRVTKSKYTGNLDAPKKEQYKQANGNGGNANASGFAHVHATKETETVGWLPSCTCDAGDPIPCLVFDPFVGSGTTVKVAYDLGRRGVGLDLSLEYLDEQARKRIHNGHTARLF